MKIEQRKMFAEKLSDFANIAAGTLILGQFVSGEPFSFLTLLLGLLITSGAYYEAYLLSK